MTEVKFVYGIGARVRLKEIDRPATVTGLLLDEHEKQYRVVYWNNGARKHEWVFDFELERA